MPDAIPTQIETALWAKAQAVADALSMQITYGEDFDPPDAPYLDCRIFSGEPVRRYLASGDPHERLYTVQITVTAREGHSPQALATIAGNVADAFSVDEEIPASSPLGRVSSAPHVDGQLIGDGNALRPVRVRFRGYV